MAKLKQTKQYGNASWEVFRERFNTTGDLGCTALLKSETSPGITLTMFRRCGVERATHESLVIWGTKTKRPL